MVDVASLTLGLGSGVNLNLTTSGQQIREFKSNMDGTKSYVAYGQAYTMGLNSPNEVITNNTKEKVNKYIEEVET